MSDLLKTSFVSRSHCKKHTGVITEFDESLWGTLVDYIVVHGRGDVRVVFRDGSEVKNEEFTKSKAIF